MNHSFLGWEGTDCEIDINECIGDVCQNGGTCIDLENDYHCKCRKGKNHKLFRNIIAYSEVDLLI